MPRTSFLNSLHRSCYNRATTCIAGNRTYLTATQSRTFSGSFNHMSHQLPCTQDNQGKQLCWHIRAPVHISDGGGPHNLLRQHKTQKHVASLYPQVSYHPLVFPRPKNQPLDSRTYDLLDLTFALLNTSDPTLTQSCWLCLHHQTPIPYALPSNLSLHSTSSNCSVSPPFLVQPLFPVNTSCITSNSTNITSISLDFVSFSNCTTHFENHSLSWPPNNTVFVCGNNMAYTTLPPSWTGSCSLATLLPEIEVFNGNEPVPIPSLDFIARRPKRAVQLIPIFATLGFTAAATVGSTGLGYSLHIKQITEGLISDVQQVASTITLIQDQLDSLTEVVLQKRRGLDLLLAEQGGLCLALQE
ncbi:syncytin-1-like [Tupaia chinensis]|uniref:syncytin-1-like n=1 Tax=Tupaia chinensis TaxID=246437 RepID=UPI0003C91E54|nr:syncytin-1-like [Tupaia chinensis]